MSEPKFEPNSNSAVAVVMEYNFLGHIDFDGDTVFDLWQHEKDPTKLAAVEKDGSVEVCSPEEFQMMHKMTSMVLALLEKEENEDISISPGNSATCQPSEFPNGAMERMSRHESTDTGEIAK